MVKRNSRSVITSTIGTFFVDTPSSITRVTKSLSVKIPATRLSLSITSATPLFAEFITSTASYTVASSGTVQ